MRTLLEFVCILLVVIGMAVFVGHSTLTEQGLLVIQYPLRFVLALVVLLTFVAWLLWETGYRFGQEGTRPANPWAKNLSSFIWLLIILWCWYMLIQRYLESRRTAPAQTETSSTFYSA